VGSIFLLQVVLIFVLSSRPNSSVNPVKPSGRLSLLSPLGPTSPSATPLWLDDPAQVALVSARGFSGPTWRRLPRLEPGWLSWSDLPQWVTQDLTRLAVSRSLASPSGVVSHVPPLAPPKPFVGAAAPPALAPVPQSTVRVEGDLGKRRRLDAPELPAWPHPDVLAPTTVQTVVDREGTVLSATLLTSSGHPGADQKALELARAARFEPSGPGPEVPPLTWGQLVFRWQVVSPSTNVP